MTRSARSIEGGQLKLIDERGVDVTIFSPRASAMEHHFGDEAVSLRWAQVSNDLIARVHRAVPGQFRRASASCRSPPASRRELHRANWSDASTSSASWAAT